MKKLLFLSPYPNANNIQDGYYQRIKNIDNLFKNIVREYLQIVFKGNSENVKNGNLRIHVLNFFRNIKKIRTIIKSSDVIYVQSIYNYFPGCLFFKKRQVVILEFHGIVPEETLYRGKTFKAFCYSIIERMAIKRTNHVVVVSHSMGDYITEKYKKKIDLVYYPIVSLNVIKKTDLKINQNGKIVFVYAGNCQRWQRINDMISFIRKYDSNNNLVYLLTRDLDEMKDNVFKNDFKYKSEIIIKTVKPDELDYYYSQADYGFLIRDNHPLNKVANPTKMLEYLWYGIIPIVDLVQIGDYIDYDYVKYNEENIILRKGKSLKNKHYAERISHDLLSASNSNIVETVVMDYLEER